MRRKEGLEQAVRLSEGLQQRDLPADRRATSHYFLGNVWENLRRLARENRGEWEQPEFERVILHFRMALRYGAVQGLSSERVCQMLTNLGNAMSAVGRPVEAIQYWDEALRRLPRFSMARGNRGHGLSYYPASHTQPRFPQALRQSVGGWPLRGPANRDRHCSPVVARTSPALEPRASQVDVQELPRLSTGLHPAHKLEIPPPKLEAP